MKGEILSLSLHYVCVSMILALSTPLGLQPHLVLPQEDIWSWVVSENVDQVPDEEPKIDNSSSGKNKAYPHVVLLDTTKVKQHDYRHNVYATNNNVESWVLAGEHIVVEDDYTNSYFIDKSKAQQHSEKYHYALWWETKAQFMICLTFILVTTLGFEIIATFVRA